MFFNNRRQNFDSNNFRTNHQKEVGLFGSGYPLLGSGFPPLMEPSYVIGLSPMIIGSLTSPSPSIKACPFHLLASWTFGKEIIAKWQSRAELRKTLWEREFCQVPDELCETRPAGTLLKEDHDVRAPVVIVLSYINIHDSAIGSMIVFVHYIMQFHSFLSDW